MLKSYPVDEKDLKRPVFGTKLLMSTNELTAKLQQIKNSIAALNEQQTTLENELFYRNNPECRPKL